MPFEWHEYLSLAQYLVANKDSFADSGFGAEAALRCATSRAYFAAFCHAIKYAKIRQGYTPTEDEYDHKNVRAHFERRNMPHIADKLDRLRQWRNACDYRETVFQLTLHATNAIANAEQVFAHLVLES